MGIHLAGKILKWEKGEASIIGWLLQTKALIMIIFVLSYCSFQLGVLLALGSFGSSAVLLLTFPENHFSQPRSIVGGHFVCSLVGLTALSLFGPTWWALASAVAVATAIMMLTRTVHPPAGSNPIIVFLSMPHWNFLFFPTLFGALTMVIVALLPPRLPPDLSFVLAVTTAGQYAVT